MIVRRIFKILVSGFSLLVAIGLLIFVFGNWSDEALSPAAQKLVAIPKPAVPDASNGYFVLLGIDAPTKEDALTAGRQLQAVRDREYAENPLRSDYSSPPELFNDGAQWGKLRCPMQGENCIDRYLKNRQGFTDWMSGHEILQTRYAQLNSLPGFEEAPFLSAHMLLPHYQGMTQAGELRLISAAYDMDGGNPAAGLEAIVGEIGVHRRLLASSRMLISKMIFVAMLRRDYQVLSEAIEHWPALAKVQEPVLTGALRPLDLRETDMRQVFQMENLFTAHVFLQALEANRGADSSDDSNDEQSGWWHKAMGNPMGRMSYLPNATLNEVAPYWSRRVEAGYGSGATVESRKRDLAAFFAHWSSELVGMPWNYLHNPAGKILITTGEDPGLYMNYVERVHDLDGYIRLVTLQAALRRRNIALDDVAAFVQQASPEMRNPYNGQAMRWDASTSSLLFEGEQGATANSAGEKKIHRIKIRFS
ncbi:MAG TPA: hypothetical protein VH105_13645 [Burkholderiales bacterium]|jgi:hypothetical protein|nr:hypothetical protein [Burkholderiales bacterium]